MRRMCYQTKFRSKAVWFNTVTLAICLALFIIVLNALPAAAQDGALAPEAQRIYDMVNQARIDNGLPPLAHNAQLTAAAQNHVDDVIAHGNWGHYGSDGSTVAMRTARAGYGSSWVSENWVAAGSPDQAMNWWLNDWIHRVNILTGHWNEIGIGAAPASNGFWIFVTDFGSGDGTAVAAAQALGESAAALVDAGSAVAVESVPSTGLDYTVRSGDTLLGIGLRHGIEWQDIALANDMAESDILSIGQVLHLPGRGGAGAAPPSTTLRVSDQTHIVRPSETLWIIAARYGVAWQDVAAVNELGEYSLLQIGQELKLPATEDEEPVDAEDAELTGDASSAPVVKQDASDAETQADAANITESTDANTDEAASPAIVLTVQSASAAYTVRAGDTLSGIAARHDVSWQALAAANALTESSYLQIGQELAIPGAATEPLRLRQTTGATGGPVAPLPAARAYTVQRGDTIFAIALRSDVDWQELLRVNNLREDSILQPGQTLQLP